MFLNYIYPSEPNVVLPDYLVAGDTWTIEMPFAQYAGWGATLEIGSGSVSLTTQASVADNNFVFVVPATETAQLAPGPYRYAIFVTSTDTPPLRQTLQAGGVPVIADPASTAWAKTDTFYTTALKGIDQCILDLLNQRTSAVSFGGKQYYFWDLEKLWTMRNELWARAQAEQATLLGNKRANLILPMFVRR
jgi:hypothetical protein